MALSLLFALTDQLHRPFIVSLAGALPEGTMPDLGRFFMFILMFSMGSMLGLVLSKQCGHAVFVFCGTSPRSLRSC